MEGKNMQRKENNDEHIHYHFDGVSKTLCKFLFILLVTISLLGVISAVVTEETTQHSNCLTACSTKHFMGIQIGMDTPVNSYYVKEFDRTECIKDCNTILG